MTLTEASELGYCDVPHKLGDATPDGKALYQIAHPQDEGCENWKSVQSHHRELTGRIAKAKAILIYKDVPLDRNFVECALEALEGK